MIITKEKSLYDMAYEDLWCIDDKLDVLTEDDWNEIESYFEYEYPNGIDITELNDMIRFEDDFIASLLGYSDWDELVDERKEEDEEETA